MARVVIVGGGFGGLYAARALRRAPVKVTVVDRRNHHVFQPLLYQVAMAALSPGDIASPIRWILRRQRNAEVILAEATGVDLAANRLLLKDGVVDYDFLIVATGATHAYFGHDEWRRVAPGLKTLEDALEIRRRVLLAFERAERETDPERRAALLTFVVIGGGPTGVEMAGALAEISRHSLARDFRHFDPGSARILLLEGGPTILSAFPETLRQAAMRDLRRLGVTVHTNSIVTDVAAGRVAIGSESIRAETVLWAAGVSASPLGAALGVPVDRAGRVKVLPDLTIPGAPNVFVIGDLATLDGAGRPAAARGRAGGDPDGQARGAQHSARARAPAAAPVSLPGPRQHGDDRPGLGDRGLRPAPAQWIAGVAGVAVRPHPQPDRLPQPAGRVRAVGLGLFQLSAVDPPDYR